MKKMLTMKMMKNQLAIPSEQTTKIMLQKKLQKKGKNKI